MVIKLDKEKACDRLDWMFTKLDLGFSDITIMECLTTTSLTMPINGNIGNCFF